MGALFKALIVTLIGYILYLRQSEIKVQVNYFGNKQRKLDTKGNLLNSEGQLIENGWATQPIKTLNIEHISWPLRKFRFKQWDYYHLSTTDQYLGISIVDLGYIQTIQFLYYNLAKDRFIFNDQLLIPMVHRPLQMGQHSSESLEYELDASFYIKVDITSDKRKFLIRQKDFEAEFTMLSAPADSIVTVTPINSVGSQFFYNEKSYNWMTEGKVRLDKEWNYFQKINGGADWGRGIWPYDTPWLWMSGQGYGMERELIAVNLGGGFQHESCQATEEAIFVNNVLHKLRDLEYIYDMSDYSKTIVVISKGRSKQDFLAEKVENGDFFVEFTAQIVNHNKKELILLNLDMHQLIGYFSGGYKLNGKIIKFQNIVGITEFQKSKW